MVRFFRNGNCRLDVVYDEVLDTSTATGAAVRDRAGPEAKVAPPPPGEPRPDVVCASTAEKNHDLAIVRAVRAAALKLSYERLLRRQRSLKKVLNLPHLQWAACACRSRITPTATWRRKFDLAMTGKIIARTTP